MEGEEARKTYTSGMINTIYFLSKYLDLLPHFFTLTFYTQSLSSWSKILIFTSHSKKTTKNIDGDLLNAY